MKIYNNAHWVLGIIFIVSTIITSCTKKDSIYKDLGHFSKVFDREKQYRIYFPKNYHSSSKEYPVIYHFHGWGGRHFKDEGANLEYELMQKLVDKYQFILVMWDGNMEESEPRPYNMGYHEHMKYGQQMKDYFLELVAHIDNTYRSQNDRNSRGIIGFSMGGMMSFYLAGKYPDKVSAAVNLVGSTEFYIGAPDNYTFYPLRYTFTNLNDVQIRLHNSTKGELAELNKETHNGVLWEGNKKYEYWEFEGGHKVDEPGKTDNYEKAVQFVINAFKNPIPREPKWSHYDLYDDFELWGYSIESDKNQPGFIFLQNVSASGFGFYTMKWLPNGPSLPGFQTTITTDAIYEPSTDYHIQDYNQGEKVLQASILKSDFKGRLQFKLNSDGHEIGIYKKGGNPKLTFIDYRIGKNQKMLTAGEKNKMTLKILNLGGGGEKKNVKISFSSNDKNIVFEPSNLVEKLDENIVIPSFIVLSDKLPTKDGSPPQVKIKLNIEYDNLTFLEEFLVPIMFDVPFYEQLAIDDGVMVKDTILGIGNGDGKVSPGEEIVIYTKGYKTQLFYDDPYITEERLFDEALPAVWPTDGITFSSIIKISKNCPDAHQIIFLGKYETKSYMPISRSVYWGKFKINVIKNKL
ncbi:MAG: alpha/beta fold hydrolase [Flavobacteriaceae bacterium]